MQTLRRALVAPARQISEDSAGDGGLAVARLLGSSGNIGFDVGRKRSVDLAESGLIDPTKPVRVALENAVSVARELVRNEVTLISLWNLWCGTGIEFLL